MDAPIRLDLFDTGIFRAATKAIVTENLWPDAGAKLSRVPAMRELASRLIRMGDRDAAQEQVRATLTSGARALLLEKDVFPLARSELPDQLLAVGYEEVAEALTATIRMERSLSELNGDLACLSRRVPPSRGQLSPGRLQALLPEVGGSGERPPPH